MMLLENDDCDPHEQRFEQMLQKYDVGNPRLQIEDPKKTGMTSTDQGGIQGSIWIGSLFF